MQKEPDFAFLKKRNKQKENRKKEQLKIKKRMLKQSTDLDSAVTVFDVDLEKEFSKLSADTQEQVKPYKIMAVINKKKYLERRKKRLNEEEKEPQNEDQIINTLEGNKKANVESYLQKNFPSINFKDRSNFWVWGKYPEAKKLLKGRKILKNLDINISHIAKYVRKIPIVFQLLKSPFYRSELELQFQKWRKIREIIFEEKLKKNEKEIEKDFLEKENILDNEEIYEETNDQFQPVLEHHQELKFGGILKNFMDIWEIEETFLTILIVLLWITGKISIFREGEKDEIEFRLELVDFPIIDIQNFHDQNEIKKAREEFIESIMQNEGMKIEFIETEIKNISKLVFNWFKEISKNKQELVQRKGIYSNLDWDRIRKLGLKSFVNDLDTLEDLVDRLTTNEIFEEFFDEINMDSSSISFRITNSHLKDLFLAEVNIIGLKTSKKKYKNELRSFSEVKDVHLLIWFMSNLLLMSSSINEKKELHERVNIDFEKFKIDVGSMVNGEGEKLINITGADETLFKFDNLEEKEDDIQKLDESDEEDYPDVKKKPSPLESYKKSDLIPDYIPILNITNHFYLSITDNIFLRQTLGDQREYELVFQEYLDKSKAEEICIEVLGILSIIPPQGEVKELFRSSSPELSKFTICSLWKNIKELVRTIHSHTSFGKTEGNKMFDCKNFREINLFDFSIEFENYIKNHIRLFLAGSLNIELEGLLSSILMDDLYLDIVRYFDNSKINAKIKTLTKAYRKKIQKISDGLTYKKLNKIETKFSEVPEHGDSSQNIPEISFFSLRKDTEVELLLDNTASCKIYLDILDNILESTNQILCKKNAEINFKNLVKDCLEKLDEMNKEKLNKNVPENLRFIRDQKGRYAFKEKSLKKKWHHIRRFTPEFKMKGEKDSSIPKKVWKKCWPFISRSYWKVQLGFLTWYSLVVDEAPYEDQVRLLLKEIKFSEAVRRQTAIKVMGILGDCFKLFRNELSLINSKFSSIPWWVFSGADCIFGYTETESEEHVDWQSMVLKNIIDWVGKRQSENYSGYTLRYDVEMSMEHFLKDFKISLSEGKNSDSLFNFS